MTFFGVSNAVSPSPKLMTSLYFSAMANMARMPDGGMDKILLLSFMSSSSLHNGVHSHPTHHDSAIDI